MTVVKRTPDEIMSVIEEAQDRLGPEFDLTALVWDVISDVLDSVDLCVRTKVGTPGTPDQTPTQYTMALIGSEIADTVRDYVSNHYGDL